VRVQVSCLVVTHQLREEAMEWFRRTARIADELVVFAPRERAEAAMYARLEALGARVFDTHTTAFYPAADEFRRMVATCRGDWILVIDHDEELSSEWDDPRWRELLDRDEFTNYWLPRRWFISPEEYIDCAPWWPDWQMRLFRNQPEKLTFPTQLHERLQMAGLGASLGTLAIHHHDLWLASRSEREAKVRMYDQLRPGQGLGYFYLSEDVDPPRRRWSGHANFDLETAILRMDEIPLAEVPGVSLDVSASRAQLRPGELQWLDVEVTNGTSAALCAGQPFPVWLAYHWLDAATREVVLFEGARTALLPLLPPGELKQWKMFVEAPLIEGSYILQVTMLQDHSCWFESINPQLPREFPVMVQSAE
ncbi:MAG: hypothetical protein ABI883_06320, partial [Chthoniobacterales bacterium]